MFHAKRIRQLESELEWLKERTERESTYRREEVRVLYALLEHLGYEVQPSVQLPVRIVKKGEAPRDFPR